MSAGFGHTECLQLLADRKADLNQPDITGGTPVGVAVNEGNEHVVQLLLALGVDANPAPGDRGDTPLSEAKSSGYSAIVEILSAAGVK
jgi:ankyrin repeat protein